MTKLNILTIGVGVLICCGFILSRIAVPVLLDDGFIVDTLFYGNLGWRGFNGLHPVLDYPHHYGGGFTSFIVLAFNSFGPTLKAIDYTYVLLFLFAFIFGSTVLLGRVSIDNAIILLTCSAAIILGVNCIEDGFIDTISHSFAYNHIAICLMMFLTVFATKTSKLTKILEFLVSLFCGGVLFFLIIMKTPFLLFSLFYFPAVWVNRGRKISFYTVLGFVSAIFLFDPALTRTVESTELLFSNDIRSAAGGIQGRILHGIYIVLAASPILLVCASKCLTLYRNDPTGTSNFIFALSTCTLGYLAASLFMNGYAYLKLLPILVVVLLLLSERIRASSADTSASSDLVALVLAALIIAQGAVASINYVRISSELKDYSLIEKGPVSMYVMPYFSPGEKTGDTREERLSNASEALAARRKNGDPERGADSYVIFADGIQLLQSVPDVQSKRIVSTGGGYDFTLALEAPPVVSYPVWPWDREGSANFLDLDDVDIVLESMDPYRANVFSSDAMAKLEDEFELCRTSKFFKMHISKNTRQNFC
ncbi:MULTISPECIES: hypothetical protein [unclassified Ruegeria]|uniref:hypothetical protein n=1 Tax=unclassified Ruegeria TaxID=2625375 RepID=UPI001487E961|nr:MULTISPECIES: hypothetical protein [unclassified Ruegeria]